MARIALVSPAFFSHVRAFEALGDRLAALGHTPVFVVPASAASMLRGGSREIIAIPEGKKSPSARLLDAIGGGSGIPGIFSAVAERAEATNRFCRLAPALLKENRIDAIVGDEVEPGAGLVAAYLGLPHVSLAAALPIERDVAMPLPFLDWPYDASEAGLARNRGGEMVGGFFMRRQRRVIAEWADRFGIGERADDVACLSPDLRLSQAVRSFDFPRPSGTVLHSVGPLRPSELQDRAPEQHVAIDPARPFVFASLGTMQGHRLDLFRKIAKACRSLDAQLMIAHCGGLSARQAERLDADFVVDFVDQRAMLARADLCVTHAGLNTALDCLAAGTPMLALPIGFDQPGIGARIAHHGVGETIPAKRARASTIREALARLIANRDAYAERIAPIRAEIEAAGSASEAAILIDRLLDGAVRAEAPALPATLRPAANDPGRGEEARRAARL